MAGRDIGTHGQFGNSRSSHEDDRDQRREDGNTKARHFIVLKDFRVVHALGDFRIDVPRQRAVQRAGDDGRRDGDDGTIDQGRADIGIINDGNRCRARMRRQEAVRDRQGRSHGDTDFQQGNLGFRRNGEDQGDEQDEADFIEQGDTDDEARQADGPFDLFPAEDVDQCRRNALGTAAFSHELAQHSTEGNDDGQAAEGPAQPFFNGRDELVDRHAFGQADGTGDEEQGQETVELDFDDEEK